MSERRLATLKEKYKDVLMMMGILDVETLKIDLQNDKLVLRGHAKNEMVSNQIWDQIKRVDPGYNKDLNAHITFDTPINEMSDTEKATTRESLPKSTATTYTVQKGDTLSKIADKFYGDPKQYKKIFEANRDKLDDPNKIFPDQVLQIPQ